MLAVPPTGNQELVPVGPVTGDQGQVLAELVMGNQKQLLSSLVFLSSPTRFFQEKLAA